MGQKTPSVGLRLGNGQGWGWSWAHYGEGGARGVYCGLMEASCAYVEGVFRSFKYPIVSVEGYETQQLSEKALLTAYRASTSTVISTSTSTVSSDKVSFTGVEGDTGKGLTYVFTVKVLANPLLSKGGFSTMGSKGKSQGGRKGGQEDMPLPTPESHLLQSTGEESFLPTHGMGSPVLGTGVTLKTTQLQARVQPSFAVSSKGVSSEGISEKGMPVWGELVQGWEHVGVSLDRIAAGLGSSNVGFMKGSRIVIRLEWVDLMSSAEALATALVYQMSVRRDRMPPSGMVKQWLKGRRVSAPYGVRVWVSGRPNGVAMAQTEKMTWGRVPTSSLSQPISSSIRTHVTKFGLLSCRVWLHPRPLRPLHQMEGASVVG